MAGDVVWYYLVEPRFTEEEVFMPLSGAQPQGLANHPIHQGHVGTIDSSGLGMGFGASLRQESRMHDLRSKAHLNTWKYRTRPPK